MNLFGKILPDVKLKFNSTSRFAIDSSPRSGIRRFGPYDANLFAQGQIKCGVIYTSSLKSQRDLLVNGLLNGESSNFPGFTPWFKARLSFDASLDKRITSEDIKYIRQSATDLANQNCDLVFVLVTQRNEPIYQSCKSILLCNGVPCQFVTATKIQNSSQRPWILGYIIFQQPQPTTNRQQPSVYTRPTVQPLPTPDATILAYIAYATQVQKNFNEANPTQPLSPTWTTRSISTCINWAEISLNDYGKTMCIEGIVLDDFSNQGVYYITFGKSPDDFYVLSYDFYYTDLGKGDCVQVRGEIRQIGQAPVIAIADPEKLTGCP